VTGDATASGGPSEPPQSAAVVDLDAYFRRIGYAGSREPTLDTLRRIHQAHALTIPFENLDPLLRRTVRLDLPSLERKLLHCGRGGYCFEQNLLLSHVLQTLGFRVVNLAARVLWNAPRGAERPRSHMLLRVDLDDEPYIADVGFGGLTLTAPLRLLPKIEQATPHEMFRLIQTSDGFVMEALVRGSWAALYRFDLQPQLLPDYEVANWFVSTHPLSHFVTSLIVARPFTGGRFALSNNQLSVHRLGAASEQRVLSSTAELRTALQDTFGLSLPDAANLDQTLARLIA
jgi:N-hydroxyarylamine O-acetyltransferase